MSIAHVAGNHYDALVSLGSAPKHEVTGPLRPPPPERPECGGSGRRMVVED